ncbi:MAG: hypothetical protein LAP85_18830 [Acidobacteriia bacterium]|nr:hypothetical protein [Terriglobia bacterium]
MPPPDESAYGSKFFDQLHSIFGIFRNEDLQRVFQRAQPIQCSELVASKGQWKTVAFFNEDRSLGEWCRNTIEEVKADLSVYTFSGSCNGEQGAVQVTTEFPVGASIELYNEAKIGLDQIDVNVNAPVNATFDPGTQAYIFELPYLFLTGQRSSGNIYSLVAPRTEDRYATDVTSRWECKIVKSDDLTYRFLICRTATVPRNPAVRNQKRELSFGASAYFILSDGMEAQTSVHLSFGDAGRRTDSSQDTVPSDPSRARPVLIRKGAITGRGSWQVPDVHSKFADVGNNEFRLRFNSQTWTGKIRSSEILADQKLSSPQSAKLQQGEDYCTWHPAAADLVDLLLASEPDANVSYSAEGFDRNSLEAASIVIYLKTHEGSRIGTLQCFFPHTESASKIDFDRWVSIVGGHLTLEIKR